MSAVIKGCAVCPNRREFPIVPASGPIPAQILLIGEKPGQEENKQGIGFVGKSGQEMNDTYLPLANLSRPDIRVTNCVLCGDETNRTPKDDEIWACANFHLPSELKRTKPDLVILVGASAHKLLSRHCTSALGSSGLSLKLDALHGRPHKVTGFMGVYTGWIVSTYHPAAALRETRLMSQCLDDWTELDKWLRNGRSNPIAVQSTLKPTYHLIGTPNDVKQSLGDGSNPAVDTEDHGGKPFSIQYSSHDDRAYMVLAASRGALQELRRGLVGQTVALHNALHDLDVTRRMGVAIDDYYCTMQETYQLGGILPQGLKSLVFRLFGVVMTSWEDVVRPASIEKLSDWLVAACDIATLDLSHLTRKRYKRVFRGQTFKEEIKPGTSEKLLTRVLRHTDITSEYDPWERLDEWKVNEEYDYQHIEARTGPYPILGIANAKLEDAVIYGGGDAFWTRQVSKELRKRSKGAYPISDRDVDQ